jgi:CRP-like cAMP-binding protein
MNADALRSLPSLAAYPSAELELLAGAAQEVSNAPGALLCREGTAGQSCFIVVRGEIDVLKTLGGAERVLATLGPGAMVGQMALVDRAPRSASVRARVPTTALELSREVFERLLRANSPFALRFQHQIAVAGIRQLRTALDRLALLASRKPAGAEPSDEGTLALACVQAATEDWDISLDDMDQAVIVVPDGQMGAAELAMRRRGKR